MDPVKIILQNIYPIIISVLAFIIGYIIYFLIKRRIFQLVKKQKLEENTAKNISKIIKIIVFLLVFSAIVIQFAETLGIITSLFTLVGGTIIGFAAMNTIGNVIAGLIIMISRPFNVGDRIYHDGRMADIIDLKLIYTVIEDLDGVEIHVPNQKVLSEEIINFRKKGNIVRRHVTVTPGFDIDQDFVEEILLKAVEKIPAVLKEPKPYVWINQFLSYAVEYKVFVFIDDIKQLPVIDSELHKAVLKTCKENGIDISTPLLLKKINE